MPIRSPNKAFTLVEALVSGGLVLLVLGIGYRFLVPLMKMQVRGGERAELQQRAALIFEDLRGDLSASTTAGISLWRNSEEVLLGMHGADNVAQDGTLVWRDWAVVYRWRATDKTWRRAVWQDPSRRHLRAAGPVRLEPTVMEQAAAQGTVTRLSSGVTEVTVETASGDAHLALPLACRFRLAMPSGETREVSRVLGGRLPGP